MRQRPIGQMAAGGAVMLLVVAALSACVSTQAAQIEPATATPTRALAAASLPTQNTGSRTVSPTATPTPAAAKAPASDSKKAGDLVVSIAFTPSPPKRGDDTIDAFVTDAQGQPISDAKVSFDIDMTNMSHGKDVVQGQSAGEGHYTGKLFFRMPGPWRVIVSVTIGNQTSTTRFDFSVK